MMRAKETSVMISSRLRFFSHSLIPLSPVWSQVWPHRVFQSSFKANSEGDKREVVHFCNAHSSTRYNLFILAYWYRESDVMSRNTSQASKILTMRLCRQTCFKNGASSCRISVDH